MPNATPSRTAQQAQLHRLLAQRIHSGAIRPQGKHASTPDAPLDPALAALISQTCQRYLDSSQALAATQNLKPEQRDSIYSRGVQAYQDKNYRAALGDFVRVLCLTPLEPAPHMAIASTLKKLECGADALLYYATACLLDPDNPCASLGLAECLLEQEQRSLARETLLTCIEQCEQEECWQPLAGRARALMAALV
jgi:predicted Zn-dependent protease